MRQIPVEEAVVGDIIAEPIQDQSGRVLLPAGAKLSQAVLARLKGWGGLHAEYQGRRTRRWQEQGGAR